jgi:hypothetical protein
MQVFIKVLDGSHLTLNVEPTDSVKSLKRLIQFHLNIPWEERRLVFCEFQLKDTCTLADYQITKDSTIHLVLRLRG